MLSLTITAIVLAGCTALGLIPLVRRGAHRRGWLDVPDGARKDHGEAVPRLGGVAIAAGITGGSLLLLLGGAQPSSDLWPLFGGAALLWAVGLWDDLYGLGFKRKFAFQLLGAYGLLLMGWRLDLDPLPILGALDPYGQALLAVPLSLVWLVGIVNAMNMTDGHDGLAGGVAIIAFGALAALAATQSQGELAAFCLVVCAALTGFLVFNWAPASIFMGDSGSLLLGFLLGGIALRLADAAASPWGLAAPAVVLGLPILDTLSCMVRRLLDNRSPFAPDADHIHHRVIRAAGSTPVGVLVLYSVALTYAALGVTLGTGGPRAALVALALVVGLSYLLLRQLSYLRARVILRRAQRRWRHHHRAVQAGGAVQLARTLFVAPPDRRLQPGDDGDRAPADRPRPSLDPEDPEAAPERVERGRDQKRVLNPT